VQLLHSITIGQFSPLRLPPIDFAIALVTVKPGEKFELKLSLRAAYQFWGPGKYEVRFYTALPLLLGDENGKFADACPIRLPVYSSEVFTIAEEAVREKEEGD
jgi:hypothetical protein